MIAWVLNLDADLELAARGRYAPSRSVLRAMAPHVARLATSLLDPSDLLVDAATPPGSARGLPGRAFCPTPRALAQLEWAGADPEPHPSLEILRGANSRAFAASLGQTLPGAAFATSLEEALAVLRTAPAGGRGWRIKRAFGMAGRGQRVVRGAVGEADLAFLSASLRDAGVQIEPDVAIETEYAMHGRITPEGGRQVGRLVRQRCDPRGAWLATERIEGAAPPEAETLCEEAERVGAALWQAGYFGPYGLDAFTYRLGSGELRLQPRSEVNARYSMGWAVGLG